MKKLFLSILLLAAFSAVALCGCNNKSAELERRLTDLEEKNNILEERVEELERENDRFSDMLDELGVKDGELYSLQKAYDLGFLTKEDMKSIAYYHNGGTEGNEEIMGEDYQPQPKMPAELDKITELSIRQTYLEHNNLTSSSIMPGMNAVPSGVTVEKYYGAYNGCYAVALDSKYRVYPAMLVDEWEMIGGVQFHFTDYLGIDLWKIKGEK